MAISIQMLTQPSTYRAHNSKLCYSSRPLFAKWLIQDKNVVMFVGDFQNVKHFAQQHECYMLVMKIATLPGGTRWEKLQFDCSMGGKSTWTCYTWNTFLSANQPKLQHSLPALFSSVKPGPEIFCYIPNSPLLRSSALRPPLATRAKWFLLEEITRFSGLLFVAANMQKHFCWLFLLLFPMIGSRTRLTSDLVTFGKDVPKKKDLKHTTQPLSDKEC